MIYFKVSNNLKFCRHFADNAQVYIVLKQNHSNVAIIDCKLQC